MDNEKRSFWNGSLLVLLQLIVDQNLNDLYDSTREKMFDTSKIIRIHGSVNINGWPIESQLALFNGLLRSA